MFFIGKSNALDTVLGYSVDACRRRQDCADVAAGSDGLSRVGQKSRSAGEAAAWMDSKMLAVKKTSLSLSGVFV